MKRLILSIIIAAPLFVMSSPANASPCTLRGTPQRDFMSGTDTKDVICARAGGDFATGQNGRDHVRGGSQGDTLVGGNGRDVILGRAGPDKLFSVDGRGGDVLRGGPGMDRCYGEEHDHFHGCNIVVTNHSPEYPTRLVLALVHALSQSYTVASRQLCEADIALCIIGKG
jgi:RTX calcium-binding nonapeptide repeat (4 copies)